MTQLLLPTSTIPWSPEEEEAAAVEPSPKKQKKAADKGDGDGKKGLADVLTAAFKKKEEMRGLCDELEVAYLKKDNASELVEKLVKAMRDDLKPALEKLKAPTLKSMLAAQSLKVGGKKEELVDRLVEALA